MVDLSRAAPRIPTKQQGQHLDPVDWLVLDCPMPRSQHTKIEIIARASCTAVSNCLRFLPDSARSLRMKGLGFTRILQRC